MKELFIVTGASQGLGQALALALREENAEVLELSRTSKMISIDLASSDDAGLVISNIQRDYDFRQYDHICLINNAAVVGPVGNSERVALEEIIQNITINLTSPMLLTLEFLKATTGLKRTIVNISAGPAVRPKATWAAYSSSKAGLRAFTESLYKEYASDGKTQVISFDPGIIDTNMQAYLRKSDFPEKQRFIGFYENGELRKPKQTAAAILNGIKQSTADDGFELDVQDWF